MSRMYNRVPDQDYKRWGDKIPFVQFPAGWKVKMLPPFTGAVVRFLVENKRGAKVSVYLDCYETLGYFGGPHWEAYPIKGNNERFSMEDVAGLIAAIKSEKEGI